MAKEKKGFWKEFKEFITRGNVLDMAVGIIIGGAFTAIITALVNNILTPLLQLIPGMGDDGFGALQVVLRAATIDAETGAELSPAVILDFGIVISAIVAFLLTAFVLFLIVRTVNRVHAKAEEVRAKREAAEAAAQAASEPAPAPAEPAPAPAPTTEELLTQIRDLLAAREENK